MKTVLNLKITRKKNILRKMGYMKIVVMMSKFSNIKKLIATRARADSEDHRSDDELIGEIPLSMQTIMKMKKINSVAREENEDSD